MKSELSGSAEPMETADKTDWYEEKREDWRDSIHSHPE